MYKVFFNDRTAILTDDFISHFQIKYGLFYKYRNQEDLSDLVSFYRHLKIIDKLFIFHYDIEELRNAFRSCFKTIDAAGGLVRDKNKRVLIIKRRGKWDLPKGKKDKKEKPPHTALREVKEECGLKGLRIMQQLLSTYHAYTLDEQQILKKIYWYEMTYDGDQDPIPQTEEEITEIRWFSPGELKGILDNTYGTVIDVLKYAKLIEL